MYENRHVEMLKAAPQLKIEIRKFFELDDSGVVDEAVDLLTGKGADEFGNRSAAAHVECRRPESGELSRQVLEFLLTQMIGADHWISIRQQPSSNRRTDSAGSTGDDDRLRHSVRLGHDGPRVQCQF